MPAQSRNRIGRHTGWLQNGNRTTIPTITHRLPRPSLAGPWAAPSWVQNAWCTFLPQRRNKVSSTTTVIEASAGSSRSTISPAMASPSRSVSHAYWEKNRHAE